jgi:TM2 domain-containing membrane protein YozV
MSDYGDILMFQQAQRLPDNRRGEFAMAYHAQHKSRSTALLLSIFLGGLAIDRFYLGQTGLAVAKLLFGWCTFGLWWLVDLFLIMRATDRYNAAVVQKLAAMYAPALGTSAGEVYRGELPALPTSPSSR